jgi:DNA modification methylase
MSTTQTVLVGHVLDELAGLPAASVQCCVTSPPYYGLRNYGTPPQCWPDGWCGHLGLEPTVDQYILHLVQVFQQVRRVLRDDGTLWLNLGDSYSSGNSGQTLGSHSGDIRNRVATRQSATDANPGRKPEPGMKPKNLLGVPWRVALALQSDGWYLRHDIIWHKPNAMPESVTDRPTKAHEYVFLLTKDDRYYYDQDAVREPHTTAFAVVAKGRSRNRHAQDGDVAERTKDGYGSIGYGVGGRNMRDVWTIPTVPYPGAHFATMPPDLAERCIKAGTSERGQCPTCGAPWQRVVVEVGARTTHGANGVADHARGAHGATSVFKTGKVPIKTTTGWEPGCTCDHPDLPTDSFELIATPTGSGGEDDPSLDVGRAGMSRPRASDEGQRLITRYEQRHYARQLKASPHRHLMADQAGAAFAHYLRLDRSGARPVPDDLLRQWIDAGWLEPVVLPERRPEPPVPQVVLDPFLGSGTTLMVARWRQRNGIGIELSAEYAEQARHRIAGTEPPPPPDVPAQAVLALEGL